MNGTPDEPIEDPAVVVADEEKKAVDETDEEEDESYHSRIVIKPGGEVVIENLSMDLLELAMMLDPESEVACEIPGLAPPKPKDEES